MHNKIEQHRVTKEMFDDWLQNPVTELVLDHLEDFRQSLATGHANVIAAGGVPSQDSQILDAGKCMMLSDIGTLGFEDIEDFYREDEAEENDDDDDDEKSG